MTDISFSILFFAALLSAGAFDIVHQKIPNMLNAAIVLLALTYHIYHSGMSGFIFSISGMLAGVACLFIPFALGGMGAGDVKLMGAVGAALGLKGVFLSFVYTAILGGVWALYLLITKDRKALGRLATDLKSVVLMRSIAFMPVQRKNAPRICYGVAIALGTMLYVSLEFFGSQILAL